MSKPRIDWETVVIRFLIGAFLGGGFGLTIWMDVRANIYHSLKAGMMVIGVWAAIGGLLYAVYKN